MMNQVTQAEAFGSYMQAAQQTSSEKADTKKNKVSGATIGDPKLSEKAAKYYEKLKKKYSNMDFILVSEDKKAEAQANAGKYANANRMVVLIDTEKIERMAEDNKYRKQYEAIISGATNQLSQLKSSLGANASSVKTYGMQVKEGTASFFAVVDKYVPHGAEKTHREKGVSEAGRKESGKKSRRRKSRRKEESGKGNL